MDRKAIYIYVYLYRDRCRSLYIYRYEIAVEVPLISFSLSSGFGLAYLGSRQNRSMSLCNVTCHLPLTMNMKLWIMIIKNDKE